MAFLGLLLQSEEGWRLEGLPVNRLLLGFLGAVQPQLPSQYLSFAKYWRLILQVVGEASQIYGFDLVLFLLLLLHLHLFLLLQSLHHPPDHRQDREAEGREEEAKNRQKFQSKTGGVFQETLELKSVKSRTKISLESAIKSNVHLNI